MQKKSITVRSFKRKDKQLVTRMMLTFLLLSLGLTLLSACGSADTHVQQQASQSRTDLDHILQQAQDAGVSAPLLQSILDQRTALANTTVPLALFNEQPVNDYYKNISTRYTMLKVQAQGVLQVATDQTQQKAQTDLSNLQQALAGQHDADMSLTAINQVYTQNQDALKKTQDPKGYAAISSHVENALATLNLMPTIFDKLQSTSQIIGLLQTQKQDVTVFQNQYNANQSDFNKATTPQDLQTLGQTIDAQNNKIATQFNQIIPQLAQAKVDAFNTKVQLLKQYGADSSTYQPLLDADSAQVQSIKTLQEYLDFAKKVDGHISSMHTDLLKGQAASLIQQFHTEAISWGNAHQFADSYNNQSYPLDGGYLTKGVGEDVDRELNAAKTDADYQQTITDVQNDAFHLQMMETNANDHTSSSQVHSTDMQLIDHYKLQQSQVIVVSFLEEALRVYDNGQLVYSFLITAGRPELPPVPGLWPVMWRESHITFTSDNPPSSPYWYPPTPINYAMLYHQGGYFLHDSWWRNDYGPGTQFYHIDSSGNSSADYGSHGCVNMPTAQAEWVYNNTSYQTQILMY
jgi:L,D-transpeptidase catalytic domain